MNTETNVLCTRIRNNAIQNVKENVSVTELGTNNALKSIENVVNWLHSEQAELKTSENIQVNRKMEPKNKRNKKTGKRQKEEVTPKVLKNKLQGTRIQAVVGNLLHQLSSDKNHLETITDIGWSVYLQVMFRKKVHWNVPALMIMLPHRTVTSTAKVCLFVPICDLYPWKVAIMGSEVTNRVEIFTVDMLKGQADYQIQKLCEEFDIYLAEECVYQEVVECLGRHILPQKFPILINFLWEDYDDMKEFIDNAFSRRPIILAGDGFTCNVVGGNKENRKRKLERKYLQILNTVKKDMIYQENILNNFVGIKERRKRKLKTKYSQILSTVKQGIIEQRNILKDFDFLWYGGNKANVEKHEELERRYLQFLNTVKRGILDQRNILNDFDLLRYGGNQDNMKKRLVFGRKYLQYLQFQRIVKRDIIDQKKILNNFKIKRQKRVANHKDSKTGLSISQESFK